MKTDPWAILSLKFVTSSVYGPRMENAANYKSGFLKKHASQIPCIR